VEAIGSGLGGNGNDASGGSAVLRLVIGGNDAELMDGVDGDPDADRIAEDADVFDTVEEDLGACGALAVDGEADAAVGYVLGVSGCGLIAGGDVSGEGDKVVGIAG
jgi:hypothetical protein